MRLNEHFQSILKNKLLEVGIQTYMDNESE